MAEQIFYDICMDKVKGALAGQRRLPLLDEVMKDLINQIAKMLLQLEQESTDPITLLIDSGGGDLEAAFFLKDVIDSLHSPVNGLVLGMSGSAALDILQMCNKRQALPNARFFAHFNRAKRQITVDVEEFSEEDVTYFFQEVQKYKQRREDLYTERSNLDCEEVVKLFRRGERFEMHPTAEQMLDWGLIDEIMTDFKLFGKESAVISSN